MKSKKDCLKEIDINKIRTALMLQAPVEITSYTLPRPMENYCYDVLRMFLTECNLSFMTDSLIFCLGELLTNAKKANTKRVYFQEKGLNILDPHDYDIGIMTFKEETLNNIDYYLEKQKKAGFYIRLSMQRNAENIIIEIRNNAKLTPVEEQRIQDKMGDIESFGDILDQTEGAGLGIKMCLLMLQKIGIPKENYQIFTNETETVTRITIPSPQTEDSTCSQLAKAFVSKFEKIPVLKDSVKKISECVNQEPLDTDCLAELLRKNPGCAYFAFVNSNITNGEPFSIKSIVEKIDISAAKELFSESSSKLQLIEKDEKLEKIWAHSVRTAFYAYNLTKNFILKDENLAQELYSIALIEDVIRVSLAHPSDEQQDMVDFVVAERELPDEMRYNFFNGGCHGLVGSFMAEKLGLPEKISIITKYHHDPNHAPEEYRTILSILYIADMMDFYGEKEIQFYQIDKELLKRYGIGSERQFKHVLDSMKKNA